MHGSTRYAAAAVLITFLTLFSAPAHAATLTRDPEGPLTRIIKFIRHVMHPTANDDNLSTPKP